MIKIVCILFLYFRFTNCSMRMKQKDYEGGLDSLNYNKYFNIDCVQEHGDFVRHKIQAYKILRKVLRSLPKPLTNRYLLNVELVWDYIYVFRVCQKFNDGLHSTRFSCSTDPSKEFENFLEDRKRVSKKVLEDCIPFIIDLLKNYIPSGYLDKGITNWFIYSSILMKKHDILLKKILNDKKELESVFSFELISVYGSEFANGVILFFEKQYDAMISDIKTLGTLSGNSM